MKKKGFTLIEIIICIALISIVSTASFFGFKIILNNINNKKLSEINDKIMNAAQVYLDKNSSIVDTLSDGKATFSKVQLKTLQNDGLIDFKDINIDDEYVIVNLSNGGDTNNDCNEVSVAGSWDTGAKFYLCTSKSGNVNITAAVGNVDNYSKATRETYYFVGAGAKNYVKYNDNLFRILSIEKDDSLVIVGCYNCSTNIDIFNGLTDPASNVYSEGTIYCTPASTQPSIDGHMTSSNSSVTTVDLYDILKASYCAGHFLPQSTYNGYYYDTISTWLNGYRVEYISGGYYQQPKINITTDYKKIHLKSCMKLKSNTGTGDIGTPLILENKC